jgi:hypothetical protein
MKNKTETVDTIESLTGESTCVRSERLRLANRLLIGAATADRGLYSDHHWQAAMEEVTLLIESLDKEERASQKIPEQKAAA